MVQTGKPEENDSVRAAQDVRFDEHTHDYTPGGGGAPAGTIALWSPLNGAIPAGWVECDGVANAPGPDLRDRFVAGRGPAHTVDTTGGASTHAHAVHAAHAVTQPSGHSAHIVTQPSLHSVHADNIAHVHTQRYFPTTTGTLIGSLADTSMSGTQTNTSLQTLSQGTGASLAHSAHAGAAVDAHSAHAGGAVDAHSAHDTPDSQPAWYALIYIQKL